MHALSSYTNAILSVEDIVKGLDRDGEESLEHYQEIYNVLDDYERDVAFFYVLGQYYQIRQAVNELYAQAEDDED